MVKFKIFLKEKLTIILIYLTTMLLWTFLPPVVFTGCKYVKTGEEIINYTQGLRIWADFDLFRIVIVLCVVIVSFEMCQIIFISKDILPDGGENHENNRKRGEKV